MDMKQSMHVQHVSKDSFRERGYSFFKNITKLIKFLIYSMIYCVKPEPICKEEGQNLAFEQQRNSLKTILWFGVFEFSIV